MKKVFPTILVIILLISLTACGSSESPVGSWHHAETGCFDLKLNKDGTGTVQVEEWSSVQHFDWQYNSSNNCILFYQDGVLSGTVMRYSPDHDTIYVSSYDVYLTRK